MLRVAGIAVTCEHVTVQVAARTATAAEHVVRLGPTSLATWGASGGRVLWDNQGHQHVESGAGPANTGSEDGIFQTLTFPALPSHAHPTIAPPGVVEI